MRLPSLRRALGLALAGAAAAALPASASASTWTVDDDKLQCPNAAFASIQAAVDQAAPWDTVVVCDGLYLERSTPLNHANSPAQAGSANGLTISKPLTIRGTGASKVTIRPHPDLGASLAGTAPYLRDGGGNVVTVSRQSLGSGDDNENFVDISGVTIEAPATYAEAGVAFFNTSGRITSSRIGPILRATTPEELAARPHGWGVVQTNSMQGAEAGPRREVTITGSLISGYQSGGVLFDESRGGADGTASTTTRSGLRGYGHIAGSRIVGAGSTTLIPQTGVRYHAGARGSVVGSEISGHYFATDPRRSVGLLLTDAETGDDPSNPGVKAFFAHSNRITGNGYGAFNATIADDAVRLGAPATVGSTTAGEETWWGCATGPTPGAASANASGSTCQGVSGDDTTPAASLVTGTPRAAAGTQATAPAATADAAPSGRFLTGAYVVAPGQTIDPVVAAADDFAVKQVAVKLDGTTIASRGTAPYEFAPSWTPDDEDAGRTFTLTAEITDSAGQRTTTAPVTVEVVGPQFAPLSAGTGLWDAGDVVVGATATREVTLTNLTPTAQKLLTADVTGAAFARTGGTCAAGAPIASGKACTILVAFAPQAAGAATGTLTVTSTASDEPVQVALKGAGVAPAAAAVVAAPPAPSQTPAPAAVLTKRAGSVTALLRRAPVASLKTGAFRLGDLKCAAAGGCRITVTARLRAGGRTFTVRLTRLLRANARAPLTLRLGTQARKALARAGSGRLTVRIATAGGSATQTTLTLKGT